MWLIALNWTWPRQLLPLGSLEDEQMDHEEGPEGGVRALRPGPAVQPWPPRSSAHVLLREGSAHVSAAVSKRVLLGAFAKVTPRLGKSGREAVISRSAIRSPSLDRGRDVHSHQGGGSVPRLARLSGHPHVCSSS